MIDATPTSLFLVFALAGCLGGGTDKNVPSDTLTTNPRPSDQPDPDPPITVNNETYELRWEAIRWSDCEGFISAFFWIGPHNHIPEPPTGWEPGLRVLTDMQMYGLHCQRIQVGPFERGPVYVFFDFHDYQRTPDGCRDHVVANTFLRTLSTLWLDDQEVVDYLRDVHGMPAIFGEFNTSTQTALDGEEYVWRMRTNEGPWSEFRVIDPGDHVATPPIMRRLFWFNETSVSYMEWETQARDNSDQRTTGDLHPPLVVSAWHTDYVSTGSRKVDAHANGQIRHFLDLFCQEPVGGDFDP